MIKTVVSVGLPVYENMIIRKNTLMPEEIKGDEKRICIVTGTHGDELEGQFVCYELNRIINSNIDNLKPIMAKSAGIFRRKVNPGDWVERGDILA